MRFKILMVDMDGVVRRWEGQDGRIEPVYGLPKGAIRQIAFAPGLLSLAVTGQITDEEWRQRIVQRLQLDFSSARAGEAGRRWHTGLDPLVKSIGKPSRSSGIATHR